MEPFVLTFDLKNIENRLFVDFGSGCGIIAVLIAKNNPFSTVVAVERNKNFIKIIEKNLLINDLKNVWVTDNFKDIETNSVDYFISNPPYFVSTSYRVSVNYFYEKFDNDDLVGYMLRQAKRVLRNKGTLRLSYHPTRFIELIKRLIENNFGIKKIRPVYGKYGAKASFVIIESMFAGKSYVEFLDPIFLSNDSSWLVM